MKHYFQTLGRSSVSVIISFTHFKGWSKKSWNVLYSSGMKMNNLGFHWKRGNKNTSEGHGPNLKGFLGEKKSFGLPFPLKCAFMGWVSVRGGCFLSARNDLKCIPPSDILQVENSQLRLELWIHTQEWWEATKTSRAKRLQFSSIKPSSPAGSCNNDLHRRQWPRLMTFIFLSSCQRSHVFSSTKPAETKQVCCWTERRQPTQAISFPGLTM